MQWAASPGACSATTVPSSVMRHPWLPVLVTTTTCSNATSGPIDTVRGTGTGVIVELVGGWVQVAAVLRAGGFTVSRDGQKLVVAARTAGSDPDEIFDAVRDAVASSRSAIRLLKARQTTLEDVFLSEPVSVST